MHFKLAQNSLYSSTWNKTNTNCIRGITNRSQLYTLICTIGTSFVAPTDSSVQRKRLLKNSMPGRILKACIVFVCCPTYNLLYILLLMFLSNVKISSYYMFSTYIKLDIYLEMPV